jgi:hypothetical protein
VLKQYPFISYNFFMTTSQNNKSNIKSKTIEEDKDRINGTWAALERLIDAGKWVGSFYFAWKIIQVVAEAYVKATHDLAGKQTSASFSNSIDVGVSGNINGNFLDNLIAIDVGSGWHWVIHGLCFITIPCLWFAYKIQKRTNEAFIQTYAPQEKLDEEQLDPQRSSSGLTKRGHTPKRRTK